MDYLTYLQEDIMQYIMFLFWLINGLLNGRELWIESAEEISFSICFWKQTLAELALGISGPNAKCVCVCVIPVSSSICPSLLSRMNNSS